MSPTSWKPACAGGAAGNGQGRPTARRATNSASGNLSGIEPPGASDEPVALILIALQRSQVDRELGLSGVDGAIRPDHQHAGDRIGDADGVARKTDARQPFRDPVACANPSLTSSRTPVTGPRRRGAGDPRRVVPTLVVCCFQSPPMQPLWLPRFLDTTSL